MKNFSCDSQAIKYNRFSIALFEWSQNGHKAGVEKTDKKEDLQKFSQINNLQLVPR